MTMEGVMGRVRLTRNDPAVDFSSIWLVVVRLGI